MTQRKHLPPQIGERFGRWTVVGSATPGSRRVPSRIPCRCDCGAEGLIIFDNLHRGISRSCGCYKTERLRRDHTTHGGTYTRLNAIWHGIKSRCYNANRRSFVNYGGRGITMCDEWRNDFVAFRDWALANGYADDLDIDRRNDGNYEPGECRWVTKRVNNQNQRTSVNITAFGETKNASAWCDDPRCRVAYATLMARIYHDWPPERALAEPPRKIARPA